MNPLKIKWDLFIIFLALYNCLFLPLELSLLPNFRVEYPHVEVMNIVIDILFLLDIIAQFKTTEFHPHTGEEITN